MSNDGARRAEILKTAQTLFASSGLRTTLKDIAGACGILPGSLYHHFASKDELIIELVKLYQAELDDIAHTALAELRRPGARQPTELIIGLAEAIVGCAVRHRAALLLSFYQPPSSASEELARLAARTPTAIQTAMLETLRTAGERGELRPGIDLSLLADRMCQSMLHGGLGVYHRSPGAHRVPAVKCRILLEGLATSEDTALNRSNAFLAADSAIEEWDTGTADHDRALLIRTIARAEFGRRGYEATTIRDIAAAAGVSPSSVHRVIKSKEELLVSIMRVFAAHVSGGWDAVLRADSTEAERLDALIWFNINVMDRFSAEFKIIFAWLRQSPPTTPDLDWSFPAHLRQLSKLLADGSRSGALHLQQESVDLQVRCLFDLIWMPENIVRTAGPHAALALSRDTVLRGASDPPRTGRCPAQHPAGDT